jgi:hypothetical protein
MIYEGITAILAENGDPIQTGIHQVAQRKINYPGETTKRDGRFWAMEGEDSEIINPATGKNHGQCSWL